MAAAAGLLARPCAGLQCGGSPRCAQRGAHESPCRVLRGLRGSGGAGGSGGRCRGLRSSPARSCAQGCSQACASCAHLSQTLWWLLLRIAANAVSAGSVFFWRAWKSCAGGAGLPAAFSSGCLGPGLLRVSLAALALPGPAQEGERCMSRSRGPPAHCGPDPGGGAAQSLPGTAAQVHVSSGGVGRAHAGGSQELPP